MGVRGRFSLLSSLVKLHPFLWLFSSFLPPHPRIEFTLWHQHGRLTNGVGRCRLHIGRDGVPPGRALVGESPTQPSPRRSPGSRCSKPNSRVLHFPTCTAQRTSQGEGEGAWMAEERGQPGKQGWTQPGRKERLRRY